MAVRLKETLEVVRVDIVYSMCNECLDKWQTEQSEKQTPLYQ